MIRHMSGLSERATNPGARSSSELQPQRLRLTSLLIHWLVAAALLVFENRTLTHWKRCCTFFSASRRTQVTCWS